MITTLTEILKYAEGKKVAIGSFNTPSMTALRAVISAAEEMNEPVILMHAQVHEEMGLCKMEEIAPVMLQFAERAKVPVCVHLDHGTDLDYIERGLKLGFTSVMYDGSALSHAENYKNTIATVEMAAKYGASVEAEIGSMGAREGGGASDESIYTDPAEAEKFVKATGVDALACAFGTAHGVYLKKPQLDLPRLAEIKKRVDVPLVMHGGSGVSEEEYRKVIELGIRKINYYTYMAIAGAQAANAGAYTQYHDLEVAAILAMKQNCMAAIKIFSKKEN